MPWIIPAWIVSCIATFWLGFFLKGITKKVAELERIVQSKVDRKPPSEEPKSILIDELDEVQTMLYEREKLNKRLNPDD
jgi:hypothetical protein